MYIANHSISLLHFISVNMWLCCRYILRVPFDSEEDSGIAYVWIGSKANPEEGRLGEEIAEDMYSSVR